MAVGHGTPNPFNDHAVAYHQAGWHPMPLWDSSPETPRAERAKKKNSPPKGFTGRTGRNADVDQIRAWVADGRYHNIATRIPNGVIGIDVDAYHGGLATLNNLIDECGELPVTVMSTSRSDGSGIRFYRVPENTEFIEGLEGIEIVQPHHRYAVVWPSIHPDVKKPYRWIWSDDNAEYDDNGSRIPQVDYLPQLPQSWLDRLIDKKDKGSLAKADLTIRERRALERVWITSGKMCSHMRNALDAVGTSTESRHDTCRNAQVAIVRLGEAGHSGAEDALVDLRSWFEMAIGGDRSVHDEWERGLEGAYRMVAASPTPNDEKVCSDTYRERAENAVLVFSRNREERQRRLVRQPTEVKETTMREESKDADEDEELGDGVEKDGRTRINVANKNRTAEWLRREVGRNQLSGMFHRGGELIYTPRIGEAGYIPPKEGHDGPAQVRIVEPLRLKTAVEVRYSVGVGKQRDEEYTDPTTGEKKTRKVMEWEPKMFPTDAAAHAHDAARNLDDTPNLRVMEGVTHTPIVRKDGSLLTKPGYDSDTGLLYLPDRGLTVRPINEEPSEIEVRKAVRLIESIVEQFPFVHDFHRANWYGALFTPIMRAVLAPPYPAFIIDAPSPGSGKSYLAMIIRDVHDGVLRAGFPNEDAEFEKQVVGILNETTAPVVQWDNVRGKVRSAKFEALLTSANYSARLLGSTNSKTVVNDRLWLITANNAEIGGDLARRAYWITIDPRMPRPYERAGFRLDLTTWIPEHRADIIHALLTIVRAWIVAGMPKAAKKRSDDYANWDACMEGMLSFAGFQGQFGKVEEKHKESDDDREWSEFLTTVYDVMGSEKFTMNDLIERIAESVTSPVDGGWRGGKTMIDPSRLPGDLAEKWAKSGFSKAGFARSLGKWFGYRAGRYVGDLVVRCQANGKKGNEYWISSYAAEQAASETA